jgi:hypothetical protein
MIHPDWHEEPSLPDIIMDTSAHEVRQAVAPSLAWIVQRLRSN